MPLRKETNTAKVTIILGTKAQLIKMAPVMIELQKRHIQYSFILTGQHKETIKELIDIFKLQKPDFILYKGSDVTKINHMFTWGLQCLYIVLKNKSKIFPYKNDITLIHGDTSSTLLGAFVGKLCNQRIGYIEAGLRSNDIFNPFPEEIFRLITSRLTDIHFCPGDVAYHNSLKYKGEKINTKTNTLYDSLQLVLNKLGEINVDIPKEKYCIVSIHRFENIFNKKKFSQIINQIIQVSNSVKVLFILHKPTKEKLISYGFYNTLKNNNKIELRPRYDYYKFIKLLKNSEFIITDGGSNQEESFYLGKPALIMRTKTERDEGVDTNALIGKFDFSKMQNFLHDNKKYRKRPLYVRIYPSKVIVDYLQYK